MDNLNNPRPWSVDIAVEFMATDRQDALRKLHVLMDNQCIVAFNENTLILAEDEAEYAPVGGVGPGGIVMAAIPDVPKHNVQELYE